MMGKFYISPVLRMCLVCFLALLACNLPSQMAVHPGISVEDLRATLAAQSTPAEGGAGGTALATETAKTSQSMHPNLFPGELLLEGNQYIYLSLPGDTLPALASRFGVAPDQIHSARALPAPGLIPPGARLSIPNRIGQPPYSQPLLPDSEVVFSPSTAAFDIQAYIQQAGGYLSVYSETFEGELLSGSEVVRRVAVESSVNPRFLLALVEHRSGWVFSQPASPTDYPVGFHIGGQSGLYRELVMVATHLNMGYYSWRDGSRVEMKYTDGIVERMSPQLNAGSAAVQSLFSKLYRQASWYQALYAAGGFLELYWKMFGDPWARAAEIEPLLPANLAQPTLELPISPGERWSLTAGPHPSWKTGSPRGALDLAPVTGEPACAVSRVWALASAPGLVVRSERNVVAIDLDGDGLEQTGWVLIYMHIADEQRLQAGVRVQVDEPLGHPSCQGGASTGTHLHIARKFNGEWLAADGPLPFVLGGWQAYADERNYYGGLIKGDRQVVASPVGPQTSILTR